MKLAAALKEKNRLIGYINSQKEILARENSRYVKSTSKVNQEEIWKNINSGIASLVKIKTSIFLANSGIYKSVVEIGEKKSLISWLKSLTTTDCIMEQR
jgi:hypothetical protein